MQDGVLCYNRGMKTNDIVYGVHAVTEALLANTGNKLYLQEDLRGKNVEKVKELATEKKVSISWTSKNLSLRLLKVLFIKVLFYECLNLPIAS